ncbi:hypothetical protein B0H11DRAFT_1112288 [Mycena galericulata]|nr:hypothetical protein B0H11DRAFT_1112288 [Mycena galericulata]
MHEEFIARGSTADILPPTASHITFYGGTGPTGGSGGQGGRDGGPGGTGEGPVVKANNVHFHGTDRILAATLSSFAPTALFDADAAATGPARRACTPDTRVALMNGLEQWAFDASPDASPIFWLSGLAGTGKSTVAYTLCHFLRQKDRLGASFFCSRNNEKSRSRASIIPTIIRQLLHVDKPFAHSLRNVHLDHVIPASARHVKELLVDPWLASHAETEQPS